MTSGAKVRLSEPIALLRWVARRAIIQTYKTTEVPTSMKQPTQSQITRFELQHQECSGPHPDGSYISIITGKKYTANYIARTYSDAPVNYSGVFLG
jgi:hypothetical protein